jgi:hypothetical protein
MVLHTGARPGLSFAPFVREARVYSGLVRSVLCGRAGWRPPRRFCRGAIVAALSTTLSTAAAAEPRTGVTSAPHVEGAPEPEENARLTKDLETAPPPPSHIVYFQYGVAFAAEQVISAGPICGSAALPCVLGSGGGIVVRGGWRSSGPLYLGGAYEVTKQDANKLYRLGLLQQARAEGRYYLMTARVTEPYATFGAGVAGYGNQWGIDTWGPMGSIGAGLEYQVTRQTVVGIALGYRLVYFSRFTDTAGAARDGGFGQLLGLDLVLEQRGTLVRAGADDHRPP